MIYLGMLLIAVSILGIILQKKTSNVIVLEEHQNGQARIVRKFVIFKFLQDRNYVMRFGFLETKNVIQIKSFREDKDIWIDVSWASNQS